MAREQETCMISGAVDEKRGTDLAYCFSDDAFKTVHFLPKSKCSWDADEEEMEVPVWLAVKEGLV